MLVGIFHDYNHEYFLLLISSSNYIPWSFCRYLHTFDFSITPTCRQERPREGIKQE